MKSSAEGRTFVFILAETELETVPSEIRNDKCIISVAQTRGKRPSNLILDSSFHHTAMRHLSDSERRGRPDIAHFFAMLCLDSLLNQEGRLTTIVHTRNDERITISPETRLPPSYHRFIGLMESLFQNGVVPSKEKPLMRIDRNWDLADVIKAEKCDEVLVLEAHGDEKPPFDCLSSLKGRRIAVIIGGLPSGELRSDISSLKPMKLSLGKEMLKVWTVTSEMLVAARSSLR